MDDLDDTNTSRDGMTVNERLFVAGVLDAFDEAVARRDRAEVIRILESVGVQDPARTTDAVIGNLGSN